MVVHTPRLCCGQTDGAIPIRKLMAHVPERTGDRKRTNGQDKGLEVLTKFVIRRYCLFYSETHT